jgi:hypothetical protein
VGSAGVEGLGRASGSTGSVVAMAGTVGFVDADVIDLQLMLAMDARVVEICTRRCGERSDLKRRRRCIRSERWNRRQARRVETKKIRKRKSWCEVDMYILLWESSTVRHFCGHSQLNKSP